MASVSIILASQSPRRQQLLKEAGIPFIVKSKDINEQYPSILKKHQVPVYLAELKANAVAHDFPNNIILAADTIVYLNGKILGKPKDEKDAFAMLLSLSGKKHEVITGVCLCRGDKQTSFYETTYVYFKRLKEQAIKYYIEQYRPYDKAGAYAIQEWIGLVGIKKIEGCFYNVVGLPVSKVCEKLETF